VLSSKKKRIREVGMYYIKDISKKARQIIEDNGGLVNGRRLELPGEADIFHFNSVPPATLFARMPCGCIIYICKGDPYTESRCVEVDIDEVMFVNGKGKHKGYLCKKHRYPKGPKYGQSEKGGAR